MIGIRNAAYVPGDCNDNNKVVVFTRSIATLGLSTDLDELVLDGGWE